MRAAIACAAALFALAPAARAEPSPSSPPSPAASVRAFGEPAPAKNAVSLHLANAGAAALALQYERFLLPPRFSLAGSLGARRSGAGDYESRAASAGAELRFWFTGRAALSDLPPRSMAGGFAAARLDLGYSTTHDRTESRKVGSSLGLSETLALGYRIAFWRGLAFSVQGGLNVRTEVDPSGRLPPWTRGSLAFAASLDWLW